MSIQRVEIEKKTIEILPMQNYFLFAIVDSSVENRNLMR